MRRTPRSEEHTSELHSPCNLVCRLLLEKKKKLESPEPQLTALTDAAQWMFNFVRRCFRLVIRRFVSFKSLPDPVDRPFFFFNDTATTEIYTLSLHDALPISDRGDRADGGHGGVRAPVRAGRR